MYANTKNSNMGQQVPQVFLYLFLIVSIYWLFKHGQNILEYHFRTYITQTKLLFPNFPNFTFVILKQNKFEYENFKNSIFQITRKKPLILLHILLTHTNI